MRSTKKDLKSVFTVLTSFAMYSEDSEIVLTNDKELQLDFQLSEAPILYITDLIGR